MQIFAIVGTREDQRQQVIRLARSNYGDENVYLANDGIFIASNGQATEESSRSVGIGDDINSFSDVVMMVNHYWSYHDRELWEWITAKVQLRQVSNRLRSTMDHCMTNLRSEFAR